MLNKYSCVITAFNEAKRINNVLGVVTRIENIDEVIVVDDGSNDNTPSVIKSNFPQVKLIIHEVNRGKVEAVRTGVNASKNNNLLLLDADLIGLVSSEIEKALDIFENDDLDCLIMLTEADKYNKLIRKIFKGTSYVAGDRIIKKEILENVLKDRLLKNYGLEIAENKYLFKNNCKVVRFQLSAIDLGKNSKYGVVKGTIGEIKMWRDIFKTAGFKFFFKQRKLFSDKIVN
ncbi:MAG TPA: glycosyltransferase [Patescibacteria group bacterium]|nr:glycosyltransferase [Patescibacteria group bacterium]